MQDQFAGVSLNLLCREYLAAVTRIKSPDVAVNEIPTGETLFVNARLLCLGEELKGILDRVPDNGIAVKGGYVVAARLKDEAAADFARYIQKRISDEGIDQLCAALKELAQGAAPEAEKPRKNIRSQKAGEGDYEDENVVGQDSKEEKIPRQLTDIIKARKVDRVEMPDARLLSFPWQLIEFNPQVIADDFDRMPFRGQSEESFVYPGVQIINEDNVVIGDNAVVKSGVVLDATDGPIIIGDRTTVMPNASIVGPVSLGADCLVKTGAKILEGTSTGNVCKIGGEIEGTIIGAYSNKQHDGFIGHSYVGEWVNIGAASNNSDLKNNYSPVRMWNAGQVKATGRQFLGLLMGDHTKTGINTLFNTGTVIGFNCNVYSSELPGKFVPSYSWGHGTEMTSYDLERAMQTATIVLERRKVKFEAAHRQIFEKIHEMSARAGHNL
jgi:UDP-N-acetylglucosamine diphosphorylase/glucosamine-1-phosphate N-acetyltransferase